MHPSFKHQFSHEALDVYRLSVEVARWFGQAKFPRGRSALKAQGLNAVDSVVLNIAEGAGRRRSGAGCNHHDIALGSAAEACSVLDLVHIAGAAEQQQRLRRIGAMLMKMT